MSWNTYEVVGVVFTASTITTVSVAIIIYLLIERPIMNLRR